MRDFGADAVKSTFGLLITIIALGLGAIGAVHEFSDRVVHFLFTKPRGRAYFVWAGWVIGSLEVLAIALVNVVAGSVTLALYSKGHFWSNFFHTLREFNFINILLYGLVYYGLTYSLTAMLRSGLKGLAASMGIMTGFWNFVAALHKLWKIEIPVPADRIGQLPMAISNIIWVVVALLLVVGAQVVVERAEL